MYLCLFRDFLFHLCTIDFFDYELILHCYFAYTLYYGEYKVYSEVYSVLIIVKNLFINTLLSGRTAFPLLITLFFQNLPDYVLFLHSTFQFVRFKVFTIQIFTFFLFSLLRYFSPLKILFVAIITLSFI